MTMYTRLSHFLMSNFLRVTNVQAFQRVCIASCTLVITFGFIFLSVYLQVNVTVVYILNCIMFKHKRILLVVMLEHQACVANCIILHACCIV